MENVQNRKRSIDVNKLAKEEADRLSDEIGSKVRTICDEAIEKANKILNIYGMMAQMQIVVKGINEIAETESQTKTPKKRGRSKKAPNL